MKTLSGVPLVYVIVLNHNGADHLSYCLPSICATDYPNIEVLVVDNASTDGSLALASNFSIRTLKSDRNLGWSGGNNLGIREALRAGARYVVLANSDIRVHPRWVAEAVTVAESSPDVAVIGFDVHEPQPGDTDRDAGYAAACRLWSATATSLSEYVGGMAMFVRGAMFEELGLIDENFFAYGEENDFQIRAQRAGYDVLNINVPVWHHGVGSFGRMPFRASLLQTENNIQLLLKHHGPRELFNAGVGHVYRRCLRPRRALASTAVERRLRGESMIQTMAILPLAVCRVAVKSPAIFRRRAEDRRLIAVARATRAVGRLTQGRNGAAG